MASQTTTSKHSGANGGLWVDHPATPRQEKLAFDRSSNRVKPTQADVLLSVLRSKRAVGKSLELPEILRLGIAQHSARFVELRRRGFIIENELRRATDGRTLSQYWLRHDPEQDVEP